MSTPYNMAFACLHCCKSSKRFPPMSVLTPMTPASFSAYHEGCQRGAEDNVASGRWASERALKRSHEDFAHYLPQELATPDNYLFEVRSQTIDAVVGILWFAGMLKNEVRSAFVYDIEIKPEHRRQDHARAAFAAL